MKRTVPAVALAASAVRASAGANAQIIPPTTPPEVGDAIVHDAIVQLKGTVWGRT